MELYEDFLSPSLKKRILEESNSIEGIAGLRQVGTIQGLENLESLKFLIELFKIIKVDLAKVLHQRVIDRKFIDERTRAFYLFNTEHGISVTDNNYKTVLGLEDQSGRIVVGPLKPNYYKKLNEKNVAPLPEYLHDHHVTLFGPPESAKMCINAMNCYHRQLSSEPEIVKTLLSTHTSRPKWGADDEDSKTPLREDLQQSGENLSRCFEGSLSFRDGSKNYELNSEKLALPIKRFPGLALPCPFLFFENDPVPMHLYDFALHFFKNWQNPEALVFYVPKLENEEEARYIRIMLQAAETLLQKQHPDYKSGSIRLMIVLENPRAVFRTHEIMDELYPYFAGASLGWHDFLASTARLFKEDGNYRIPIKADPDIVIKYIKASHELLAEVVGARGGIKVGGMYGILPQTNDLQSESFQLTLKGYFRDVITQMKRKLDGFWVAHPDFIRLGLAMVEAWKFYEAGDKQKLTDLVCALLQPKYQKEVLDFISGPDIESLDPAHPRYARALIVSDLKASSLMSNSDLEEVRYNVFQTLQYLTDWLSGNGCVALPALVGGVAVRVMDDLATCERSRWEVWHEIHNGRVTREDFLKIAHEEMLFIRKDLSNSQKIVQVKWDNKTARWYPLAFKLMLKLMSDKNPPEFVTELLLPLTLDFIRNSENPWDQLKSMDAQKYHLDEFTERFNEYFEYCGHKEWAASSANQLSFDAESAKRKMLAFSLEDIVDAAAFHGNIGEAAATLDAQAAGEQAKVSLEQDQLKAELLKLGAEYQKKFKMKFLISASDRGGAEILTELKERFNNSPADELTNARQALWQITEKRIKARKSVSFEERIEALRTLHQVRSAQVAVCSAQTDIESYSFGESAPGVRTRADTFFELASLSKSLAAAFAIDYFRKKEILLSTSVNTLFEKTKSDFRLKSAEAALPDWAKKVTLEHLLRHEAVNKHYVRGYSASGEIAPVRTLLKADKKSEYEAVEVISEPGAQFNYSGGGFMVLEHLIEALESKPIELLCQKFLDELSTGNLSFDPKPSQKTIAHGLSDTDDVVPGTRLMFPAFAAGALGNAQGVLQFLQKLEDSFHNPESKIISHDTAVQMLHGRDLGSLDFMGAKMGLGIFVSDAGLNKIAIHQGANDGFRALFMHCFKGPNRGSGIVLLCNTEMKAVRFIADVAKMFLKELRFEGVDFSKLSQSFNEATVKPEQRVNRGYKDLIFSAFEPLMPEPIARVGPTAPLSSCNLVVGSKIVSCTDQIFACAQNLISPFEPVFEPDLYGEQGKVMDSWESGRHSMRGVEDLILELVQPSQVHFVEFSTKFHYGNHVPKVSLLGRVGTDVSDPWMTLVPQVDLEGHAFKRIKVESHLELKFVQLRVRTYSDGGLTRMGVFDSHLPSTEQKKYLSASEAKSEKFSSAIPVTHKPLSIPVDISIAETKELWMRFKKGDEVNLASLALGAKILKVSNEHYGPVNQMLSPYAPLNMFDGFESARSRTPGHFEEAHVQLAKPGRVHRLEFDFKYYVNNNPVAVRVEALSDKGWHQVVPLTPVKAFAANTKTFELNSNEIIQEFKIYIYPDGGINRFKAFATV